MRQLLLAVWVLLCLARPIRAVAQEGSPDEALLLQRVRALAAAPLDDFSLLGDTRTKDSHYRYQLAFLSYGLCSLAQGDPALRPEAGRLLVRLIEKMERPSTLAYWKARRFEGDGLTQENAMYRGHLNLMYALARDRFKEPRFDARFHELSRALAREIAGPRPICCEPDHVFVQCNAVAVLSLYLHDRSFGTDYARAGKQLLAWARTNMPLRGTTLICEDYRPSTGRSSVCGTGYANAWTIAFLAGVPELAAEARAMYADWRRTFLASTPVLGIVKGAPDGEPVSLLEMLTSSLLATTFGLLATRAAGDEWTHLRLRWTISCVDRLVEEYEPIIPPSRRAEARTFRTVALFARTFRGWQAVLEEK